MKIVSRINELILREKPEKQIKYSEGSGIAKHLTSTTRTKLYEYYVCDLNLDEDDMVRFLTGNTKGCPYYQLYDEYKVVRHQM